MLTKELSKQLLNLRGRRMGEAFEESLGHPRVLRSFFSGNMRSRSGQSVCAQCSSIGPKLGSAKWSVASEIVSHGRHSLEGKCNQRWGS